MRVSKGRLCDKICEQVNITRKSPGARDLAKRELERVSVALQLLIEETKK